VKIDESFSRQRDQALWSENATKRETLTKESHPRISPESINRGSSLWEIIFIDDSFLICPFTDGLSEEMRGNRILDTHSFLRVISIEDSSVSLDVLRATGLIIALTKRRKQKEYDGVGYS